MFRACYVGLTIFGILACPLFCAEGEGLSGIVVHEKPNCCGHGCKAETQGQPCHESSPPKQDPCHGQDGCQVHVCVCKGAVETRTDYEVHPTPSADLAVVPMVVAANPLPSSVATFYGRNGPPYPPLPSGHEIRVALQSFIL